MISICYLCITHIWAQKIISKGKLMPPVVQRSRSVTCTLSSLCRWNDIFLILWTRTFHGSQMQLSSPVYFKANFIRTKECQAHRPYDSIHFIPEGYLTSIWLILLQLVPLIPIWHSGCLILCFRINWRGIVIERCPQAQLGDDSKSK